MVFGMGACVGGFVEFNSLGFFLYLVFWYLFNGVVIEINVGLLLWFKEIIVIRLKLMMLYFFFFGERLC